MKEYYVKILRLCIDLEICEGDILILLVLKKYQVVRVEKSSYNLVCGMKNNCVW